MNSATACRAASTHRPQLGAPGLDEDAAAGIAGAPGTARELREQARTCAPRRGSRGWPARGRRRARPRGETPGMSWPLATSCVPTSTAAVARRNARSVASGSPGRAATSASSRITSTRGKRLSSSSSTRVVPAPRWARSTEPQVEHARGSGSPAPQWWQTRRRPWSTSETSQRGQRHVRPHVRQWIAEAAPRRFWSRIARPPSSSMRGQRVDQRPGERVAAVGAQVDDVDERAAALPPGSGG